MPEAKTYELNISGAAGKPKAEVKLGDTKFPAKLEYSDNWVVLSFKDEAKGRILQVHGHNSENRK